MKSISKPPLPIEIFTLCQNLSLDDYEVSRLEGKFARQPDFEDSTKSGYLAIVGIEVFRLKEGNVAVKWGRSTRSIP
jgi:hypothetical protein